jgi:O-antigen/teichoic acid export membrane protein
MSTRIARGFAWNHLYKIVEYGLMTLYSVIVMRVFGPELTGSYAVYLSISAGLAIVGAVGIDGALLRYLPRLAQGERAFGEMEYAGIRPFIWHLFAFRLAINLVLIAIIVLVLGILPGYFPSLANALGSLRQLVPFLAIYLLGQAIVAFSTFTLIGLLQTKWVFVSSLVSKILILTAGTIVVLTHHLTLEWAAGMHAVTALVNGLLLLYWVYRKVVPNEKPGFRSEAIHVSRKFVQFVKSPSAARGFLLLPFMLYGLTTWGNDILSTVLGRQPDILMMRAILGENARDIGLYHSAAQLVLMTEYIFLFGLGGTLVSVFSELAYDDERKTGHKSYPGLTAARKDVAGFQAVTTAPLFGFMMVFAPLVVEAVYGHKYDGAAQLVVYALAILFVAVVAFGGGMHITSLVAVGKERWVFRNRLSWGAFNLVINYFLIHSYGGLGAIIGTQVCNAGTCMVESWYAHRVIGPSLRVVRVLPIVSVSAVSIGVAYLVLHFILGSWPAIAQVIVAGLITGALTISGYALFKLPEASRVLTMARKIIVKKKTSVGVMTPLP